MNNTITVKITTVDVSDKRHPEKSGRYISLMQLLAIVSQMREANTPISELERLLRQTTQ